MAKRKFTNAKVFRTRPSGSVSAAYGGAVTGRTTSSTKAMKTRGGFMGMGRVMGGLRKAAPTLKRMARNAMKTRFSEDDVKMMEAAMSAANQANPISFDLKGTAIGLATAAAANPKVQKMVGEAVKGATDYAFKKGAGVAAGVFKQIEVQPSIGGNSKDIRVASTSVHRMVSGLSVTEQPVGIMYFDLGRKQSVYIKKVKSLYSTATKFYTYQSEMADKRFYTTGLNSKGSYWGGNSVGASNIQPILSSVSLQANFTAITAATLPVCQLKGDDYPSLTFTTYDDILALYQTIPVGSASIVDTTSGATAGQDIRFPMESRRLEFELTNLNKYLNGHFEIYRLTAKTDIGGNADSPEQMWYDGSSQGPGTTGVVTDTMYNGSFQRSDPTGLANPPTYNGGVDFNLKATPGLSSKFKQFWSIEEVRKFIVKPDQTVKIVFNETLSNGFSLDEMTRRIVTTTGGIAIPAGGTYFMIVARTNPLYVERAANGEINAAYNIIAESGFLNYKISSIKKTYSAHVPRRGDSNEPWSNCLGMAQTTSIVLPRYEYAPGNALDSTGAGTAGKYSMPLVTPNQVQYGGLKD